MKGWRKGRYTYWGRSPTLGTGLAYGHDNLGESLKFLGNLARGTGDLKCLVIVKEGKKNGVAVATEEGGGGRGTMKTGLVPGGEAA